MQMAQPKGRVAYEPSSLAGRLAARDARRGFPQRRRRRKRGERGRIRAETLRRPLQPGAAVLSAARRALEQAHIASALVFELSKVEHRAHPRGDRRPPAPHRRRPRRARRRRSRRSTALPPRRRRRGAGAGHAAVARAADHRQDEGHAGGPRGRHPGRRRLRRRRDRGAAQGRDRCRRHASRSSRRRSAARSSPTARRCRPTDSSPARRRCCSMRSRSCSRTTARQALAKEARRDRLRARCLRPPQGDRRRRRRPGRCCRGRRRRRTPAWSMRHDSRRFIEAAKTRQWAREPGVRTLA